MITIDEMKEIAANGMDFAVGYVQEKGALNLMFHLFRSNGDSEIVMTPREAADDDRAKAVVSGAIREKVAAGGYDAVMMISNALMGRAYSKEAAAEINRIGVEAAARRGLCTMRRALVVTLDSPIYTRMTVQYYQRDEEAECIHLEECLSSDSLTKGSNLFGRMARFFPEAKRA